MQEGRMDLREPPGIHVLPHATLHQIMLEVALQVGRKQQWQQGACLSVLARVSRSWRDLAENDDLWRSLCEGPEHWLIRELSLAAPTAAARLAHRQLYRTHYLLAKSKPESPCATVGTCRSPAQMAAFVEATKARQTADAALAACEQGGTMPAPSSSTWTSRRATTPSGALLLQDYIVSFELSYAGSRISATSSRFLSHGFGEEGGGQVSLFDLDSVPWCFADSTTFAEVDWNLLSLKVFATHPRTLSTVLLCESTLDDPSMHCIFRAGELCVAPPPPNIYSDCCRDLGDKSDRGEAYGEVEDFELGLTCWFVATSVPIAFSATCSWDSGVPNAFDHVGSPQPGDLQERCTFDGKLRFELTDLDSFDDITTVEHHELATRVFAELLTPEDPNAVNCRRSEVCLPC